jgi:hypothetical protein
VTIPGLFFLKEFLSENEERAVVEEIDKCPWAKMN